MKIYFAGAIRGGRQDAELYFKLIAYLQNYGKVLTEHIGSSELSGKGETNSTNKQIFNRDITWLKSANLVIAEVTTPSLGVGYELGIAEKLNIPVLCLYRIIDKKRLSAMLTGNSNFICNSYNSMADAKKYIDIFIKSNN